MVITTAEINSFVGGYLWPLFRVGAALGAMPLLGGRMVPVRIRLGLAIVLTLVIAPLVPASPAVDPLSVAGALISFNQVLIGAAMGFALTLVFAAFVHGAQIIAMQMGLGFASLVDPQNGVEVPVVSQFYSLLVMLLFLAMDGHLVFIETLAASFHTLPVSPQGLTAEGFHALAAAAGQLFAGSVRIALPAIAALLLVNMAFGVMSRAAPQLNIFAVGFPLSLLLGFAVILFTLPAIVPQFTEMLGEGFGLVRRLTGVEE